MHYGPPERSERRIVLGATGRTAVIAEVITQPGVPVAAGPYPPGLLTGDRIFPSGQGGFDPETGELVSDNIAEETAHVGSRQVPEANDSSARIGLIPAASMARRTITR